MVIAQKISSYFVLGDTKSIVFIQMLMPSFWTKICQNTRENC